MFCRSKKRNKRWLNVENNLKNSLVVSVYNFLFSIMSKHYQFNLLLIWVKSIEYTKTIYFIFNWLWMWCFFHIWSSFRWKLQNLKKRILKCIHFRTRRYKCTSSNSSSLFHNEQNFRFLQWTIDLNPLCRMFWMVEIECFNFFTGLIDTHSDFILKIQHQNNSLIETQVF